MQKNLVKTYLAGNLCGLLEALLILSVWIPLVNESFLELGPGSELVDGNEDCCLENKFGSGHL